MKTLASILGLAAGLTAFPALAGSSCACGLHEYLLMI